MSHPEIRALITLIDDPDETIYSQVRDRIVELGDGIMPELERTSGPGVGCTWHIKQLAEHGMEW